MPGLRPPEAVFGRLEYLPPPEHLTVEDARKTLEEAGWFTGREVRL